MSSIQMPRSMFFLVPIIPQQMCLTSIGRDRAFLPGEFRMYVEASSTARIWWQDRWSEGCGACIHLCTCPVRTKIWLGTQVLVFKPTFAFGDLIDEKFPVYHPCNIQDTCVIMRKRLQIKSARSICFHSLLHSQGRIRLLNPTEAIRICMHC